jgi:hypothetical protein
MSSAPTRHGRQGDGQLHSGNAVSLLWHPRTFPLAPRRSGTAHADPLADLRDSCSPVRISLAASASTIMAVALAAA